jgi:hypothetical protein
MPALGRMARVTLCAFVLAALAVPGGWAQRSWEGLAFATAPYDHALDFVDLLIAGHFWQAEALLSPEARAGWSAGTLERAWKAQEKRYGEYFKRRVSAADFLGDRWRIHVLVQFVHGSVDAQVDLTSMSDDPAVLRFQMREAVEGRLPG